VLELARSAGLPGVAQFAEQPSLKWFLPVPDNLYVRPLERLLAACATIFDERLSNFGFS
jgi:hypothetical protein